MVADQAVDGVLPAIFEKANPGYASRILPAVEGCAYPLYFVKTGFDGGTLEQVFGSAEEKRMYRRAERTHSEAAAGCGSAESVCRRRDQAFVDEQQLVDEQDFDLHARDAEECSIWTKIRRWWRFSARRTRRM